MDELIYLVKNGVVSEFRSSQTAFKDLEGNTIKVYLGAGSQTAKPFNLKIGFSYIRSDRDETQNLIEIYSVRDDKSAKFLEYIDKLKKTAVEYEP